MKTLLLASAIAASALAPLLAHAGLVARDLDGIATTAEAYYDTTLNITWLRDRNHLVGVTPGMAANGYADWNTTAAAIVALNANAGANYGLSGWRMPRAEGVHSIGGTGCQFGFDGSTDCGSNVDPASSELAYMFDVNLGNRSSRDTQGNFLPGTAGVDFGLVNDEDFLNLEPGRHWSSTSSYRLIFNVPQNGKVSFDFSNGTQGITAPTPGTGGFTWLVHDGDVGAAASAEVPAPASAALAGLALLTLLALSASRRRTVDPK